MKNILKKLALYSATIGLLSILLVSCEDKMPFQIKKHEYISYNELVTNQQLCCVTRDNILTVYATSSKSAMKKYKDKTINLYNQQGDNFYPYKHNKLIIITYQIK